MAIWVAKRDIPAGTSGADIERKGMLGKSEIVRRSVVPGAISNPGPGRRAGHLAADLRGRAGFHAPLRDAVTARDQGPADRRPARDRDSRRPESAPRRHAQGRRQGRPRRHVRRRRLERAERHAHRPPRHRGAPRAVGRRDGGEDHLALSDKDGAFAAMLEVTDTQVQKLAWVFTTAEHWHLELRPGIDAADSPENVESWYSVLREGVRQKQLNDAGVDGSRPLVEGTPMNNESIRIYVTGSCEGLDNLRDAARQPPGSGLRRLERERRRGDDRPRRRPPPGRRPRHPLDVLPRGRGRCDPRAHPLADRDPRLRRVVGPARGGSRRRGRRGRPAAAAADRERRLRAPQGGARRPPAGGRGRGAGGRGGS